MSMTYKNDLTGKRFGRLVVLQHEKKPGRITFWLCQCDCGKKVVVSASSLCSGGTKSCGCFRRDNTSAFAKVRSKKHGMYGTRLYNIWTSMKQRCRKNPNYSEVEICDEWQDFSKFMEWALSSGYSDSLTIDRIDVYGNYEPSNCRWATMAQQANNRKCTIRLTIDGETKALSEWAKEAGLRRQTVLSRVKAGWPEKDWLIPSKNAKGVEQ